MLNNEAIIFGRHIITKRKVAWYAATNYEYTYSTRTKLASHWAKELIELKKLIDEITGTTFNSCLLNLYHSGDEGMSWRSDDEKTSKRFTYYFFKFWCRKKIYDETQANETTHFSFIRNGSLLEMKGTIKKTGCTVCQNQRK